MAFCLLGTPLQLEELQSRLLDVGSAVATPIPTSSEAKLQRVAFDPSHTPKLEAWIDEMNEELPPLTQFILPSGACRRFVCLAVLSTSGSATWPACVYHGMDGHDAALLVTYCEASSRATPVCKLR